MLLEHAHQFFRDAVEDGHKFSLKKFFCYLIGIVHIFKKRPCVVLYTVFYGDMRKGETDKHMMVLAATHEYS